MLTTGPKCLASVGTKPKQLRLDAIRCVNLRATYWGYNLDTRALRNTLGQFATGVCILTTQTSDNRSIGMTVNSFAAVSLDPALVLWSIQNSNRSIDFRSQFVNFATQITRNISSIVAHIAHKLFHSIFGTYNTDTIIKSEF